MLPRYFKIHGLFTCLSFDGDRSWRSSTDAHGIGLFGSDVKASLLTMVVDFIGLLIVSWQDR